MILIKYLNLSLLALLPASWLSPLITASLLPQWQLPDWLGGTRLFEAQTLSIMSGIGKLWETDIYLAMVVIVFALVFPLLKCLGLALIHFNVLSASLHPLVTIIGKLAMVEVFMLSLHIIIATGIGAGEIRVEWGLYLFTGTVLASLVISLADNRYRQMIVTLPEPPSR